VVVDHYAAAADVVRLEALYPVAWVKDFGSAALHLAGVSSGMFDAYVNPRQKSHEIVAGYLLINEAGGVVSDFSGNAIDGRPFDFDATYDLIAAANDSISESIRALIRR
jgi:myo-inositol-1(or 4)-monophosphatase